MTANPTANPTAALINRLPRWFVEQARAVDAQAARRQQAWEDTRRRNNALARPAAPELPRAAEAGVGGSREAWQDTVAGFSAR